MIARQHRLPLNSAERFFGTINHTPIGKCVVAPNTQNTFRFGCIVSKKNIKRAVDRNRLRRRLAAAISKSLNKDASVDVLIIPKKETLDLPFGVIVNAIEHCLKR